VNVTAPPGLVTAHPWHDNISNPSPGLVTAHPWHDNITHHLVLWQLTPVMTTFQTHHLVLWQLTPDMTTFQTHHLVLWQLTPDMITFQTHHLVSWQLTPVMTTFQTHRRFSGLKSTVSNAIWCHELWDRRSKLPKSNTGHFLEQAKNSNFWLDVWPCWYNTDLHREIRNQTPVHCLNWRPDSLTQDPVVNPDCSP